MYRLNMIRRTLNMIKKHESIQIEIFEPMFGAYKLSTPAASLCLLHTFVIMQKRFLPSILITFNNGDMPVICPCDLLYQLTFSKKRVYLTNWSVNKETFSFESVDWRHIPKTLNKFHNT